MNHLYNIIIQNNSEATKHYFMNAQRVATSVISYVYSPTEIPYSYEPYQLGTPGSINVVATIIDKIYTLTNEIFPSEYL
ncbi:MAG: hypothetical protein JJU02_17045, partial [Cryomorphaceae bacterium]|nr:hypothetical protein [Cryomorphaceae bacterium]